MRVHFCSARAAFCRLYVNFAPACFVLVARRCGRLTNGGGQHLPRAYRCKIAAGFPRQLFRRVRRNEPAALQAAVKAVPA